MATEVKVTGATIEVRACKLTRALLKQVRRASYHELQARGWDTAALNAHTVGWVHGSVLGDEFSHKLLVSLGDGDYALLDAPMNVEKKHKQLYID